MNEKNGSAAQQQQQVAQTQSLQQKAESSVDVLVKCPRCGTAHPASEHFCTECGVKLHSHSCSKCGAETQPGQELCPQCGNNLKTDMCSFCGAMFEGDEAFCPECGNPRAGIRCPSCATLNYRSFCRQCNTPLNDLAQAALKAAREDPKVQRAIELAQEMAELESFLMSDEPTTQDLSPAEPPQARQLSQEDIELMQQYKDVLATLRQQKPSADRPQSAPPPKAAPAKPATEQAISFKVNIRSKEEAMAKYKAKLEELKQTLSSMIPDAGMTPQMQRNYHSARKVEIITQTKIQVPMYWRCNAFGCYHSLPNECSQHYSGGVWFYEEKVVNTTSWVHQ